MFVDVHDPSDDSESLASAAIQRLKSSTWYGIDDDTERGATTSSNSPPPAADNAPSADRGTNSDPAASRQFQRRLDSLASHTNKKRKIESLRSTLQTHR